jgi:cob(I)alamin adenosyltransferase
LNAQFEEGAVSMMSVQDDVVCLLHQQRLPHESISLDGLPGLLEKSGKKLFVRLQEASLEEGEGDIQAPTSPAGRKGQLASAKKGVGGLSCTAGSTYTPLVVRVSMPLYTGRGDAGETDLLGGRVSKDHKRIEALGALDELNAALGVALSALPGGAEADLLGQVQNDLFTVGAELATAPEQPRGLAPPLGSRRVKELEKSIASLEARLDPQKAFVLPGGSQAAAQLHFARAVSRRAERRVVALHSEDAVNPETLRYLNRLSTLLHALALWANLEAQVEERHPRY